MRRDTRLLHTAGFRYAAGLALIFAAGMLLFNLFVYYGVRSRMEEQLREYVLAETRQLLGDYEDQGLDELRHDISERLELALSPRFHYTLANARGDVIFDRLSLPEVDGWQRLQLANGEGMVQLTTTLKEGYRLGVAAETDSIEDFSRAFRHITLLALVAVLLLSTVAGIIISRRFLVRLDRFKKTADSVGSGALSARIPVANIGDDFEQLALTINRMLDRIEHLMNDVRYVSASIAHDLRTPLGRLRQRLENLAANQQGEENRQACTDAIANLDDILENIPALLRITELESGSLELNWKTLDVGVLLQRLEEAYRPVAEDSGQVLECHCPGAVLIRGDEALLTQLLVNLLENALHHNGEGVTVSISVEPSAASAEHIDIVIADNGVGIPENRFADVLKPFYKLESSRTSAGNGFGLSLARSIAMRHGARFVLEDNQPGLCVRITFPVS